MQNYLKSQWAGLMYRFLTSESEAKRVGDILSSLRKSADNIEFLTRQVASSVVTDPIPEVAIELYDILSESNLNRQLTFLGADPTPQKILQIPDLLGYLEISNIIVERLGDGIFLRSTYLDLDFDQSGYDDLKNEYLEAREELLNHLKEKGISKEEFLSYFEKK